LELFARGGVFDLSSRSLLHVHGRGGPRAKAFVLAEQVGIECLFAASEFIKDLLLGESVAA
jgi:hypothetical protein